MVFIKYTRKRLSTLFYRVWINLEYFVYTHYSLLGSVFVFFWSLFWRYLGNIPPDIFVTYECNAQPDIDSNTNSHGHVCKGNEIDTWGDWLYRNRHIIMIGGAFLAIALSIYFEVPLPVVPPIFPDTDNNSNRDVEDPDPGYTIIYEDTREERDNLSELMMLSNHMRCVREEREELAKAYVKVLHDANLSFSEKKRKLDLIESKAIQAAQVEYELSLSIDELESVLFKKKTNNK